VYTEVGIRDVWEIPYINSQSKERIGYPTQKPLALLKCVIRASGNEGDTVSDPFCGCATTCVAAERLKRKWIGTGVLLKAYELVKEWLGREVENKGMLFYEELVQFQTSPPQKDDKDVHSADKKYVYIISRPQCSGEYNVGIASDVKSRLGSYQAADPGRGCTLEYSISYPSLSGDREAHIHEECESKHEWVRGKSENIKHGTEHYHKREPACACPDYPKSGKLT